MDTGCPTVVTLGRKIANLMLNHNNKGMTPVHAVYGTTYKHRFAEQTIFLYCYALT